MKEFSEPHRGFEVAVQTASPEIERIFSLAEGGEKEDELLVAVRMLPDAELPLLWEALQNSPRRHLLSQVCVNAFVERGMRFFEEYDASFTEVVTMADAFQLHGDFTRQNEPEKESLTDRAFRALLTLYEKYPRAGHELEIVFGQSYGVRPDILIDETAQAVGKYGGNQSLKQELLHSLQYLHAFGGGAYDAAIARNLDFKNSDHYFRTATFLEFIKRLYLISREEGFSEEEAPRLAAVLKEVLDKNEGSYLLNMRAREVYETMTSDEWHRDWDKVPVLVAPGRYAYHRDGILLMSNPSDTEFIHACIQEIESVQRLIHKHLQEHSRMSGSHPYRQQETALYRRLLAHFRPVTAVDVGLTGKAGEEDIADYAYLLSKPVRQHIEQDFNVKIADLSLPEQFQLLNFLKTKEARDVSAIQAFARTYGAEGFRTFLSLEYGREFGDEIVSFGEHMPKAEARHVFAKYAEVVGGLSDIEQLVPDGPRKTFVAIEAKEMLLRRARKLLESVVRAEQASHTRGRAFLSEKIVEDLSRVSTENQTLLSVFKATQGQDPWVTFEHFKDVAFAEETVGELSPADVARMKKIYAENYEHTPNFRTHLLENFDTLLSNRTQPVHVIRHKGDVVGFYLYTPRADGSRDFRCFNVDPVYAGGGFGRAVMNHELRSQAAEAVIHATCTAELPISSEYIESGFVAGGFGQADEISFLEIARNDQKQFFPTKEWTRGTIAEKLAGDTVFQNEQVYIAADKNVRALPFNLAGKKEGEKRYILTRYVRPTARGDQTVLVFEKKSDSDWANYNRMDARKNLTL